jgi:hypothetical protein
MIVNDPSTILRPIDQAMGTDLVDQSGCAAGEAIDLLDSAI